MLLKFNILKSKNKPIFMTKIVENYYNNDSLKLNLKGMSPIQYRAHYYQI